MNIRICNCCRRCSTAAFLLGIGFAFFPSGARASIIDTYTAVAGGNPDSVSVGPGSGSTQADFPISPTVTDPVGSVRRLVLSQFAAAPQSASLTIDGTSGDAAFTSTALANSNWSIFYGVTVPGGLHFNATAGGADAFRLTLPAVSAGKFEFVIAAYGYTGSGVSNSAVFQPLTAGTINVPYSSFSNFGTIGFNNLNQIEFRVRTVPLVTGGTTVSLTQFETASTLAAAVPEPSGFVLGGLAIVGFVAARRRRQNLPFVSQSRTGKGCTNSASSTGDRLPSPV